ncbi:MAG: hypothetical protein ABIS07_00145, partial [Dokdonella sp.]
HAEIVRDRRRGKAQCRNQDKRDACRSMHVSSPHSNVPLIETKSSVLCDVSQVRCALAEVRGQRPDGLNFENGAVHLRKITAMAVRIRRRRRE